MPEKKWMFWGNELYYSGDGRGDAYYLIDAGDVEIRLDEKGEILEIVVKNIDKYLEPEEIEKIAYIQEPKPPTRRKTIENKHRA